MSLILVTPLSAVPAVIRSRRPSHLVTLLSPEHMIDTPDGFPVERHLRLGVNDIVDAEAGDNPPARSHVRELLDFSRAWEGHDPILVHCWAGVSRSMAATYAILCDRLGPGCELHAAQAIRNRAPQHRRQSNRTDPVSAKHGLPPGNVEHFRPRNDFSERMREARDLVPGAATIK